MRVPSPFGLIGALALIMTSAAYAQRAPAIPGVTGTMATDTTVKQEYKLANKIVVATEDGVKHVFPAGKGALSDMMEGSTVVVHHGTEITEGTLSKVSGNDVTVRYANGKTEDLVVSKEETKTVVEYKDAEGDKIARYFKPKS